MVFRISDVVIVGAPVALRMETRLLMVECNGGEKIANVHAEKYSWTATKGNFSVGQAYAK